MPDDKRSSPRMEMLAPVPGEITILAPIALRDLSVRGAQVESAFPLLLNSVHDIRLHLGDDSVVLKCRVAYCRVTNVGDDTAVYRAGVEFIDVPEHAAEAIAVHLERVAETPGERE